MQNFFKPSPELIKTFDSVSRSIPEDMRRIRKVLLYKHYICVLICLVSFIVGIVLVRRYENGFFIFLTFACWTVMIIPYKGKASYSAYKELYVKNILEPTISRYHDTLEFNEEKIIGKQTFKEIEALAKYTFLSQTGKSLIGKTNRGQEMSITPVELKYRVKRKGKSDTDAVTQGIIAVIENIKPISETVILKPSIMHLLKNNDPLANSDFNKVFKPDCQTRAQQFFQDKNKIVEFVIRNRVYFELLIKKDKIYIWYKRDLYHWLYNKDGERNTVYLFSKFVDMTMELNSIIVEEMANK